jgi:LPS export ABC transporter protein LptC
MQQKFWQRIRLVRWLICLAMVGTVLALFAGFKLRSAERLLPAVVAKAAKSTSDDANIILNNFDYFDVKEGNARWRLRAATARYFEDRKETVLSQVNAVFYLKDGGKIELQGDDAVFHNDSNNMEINGNVRVRYEDDYSLLTDRLLYEHEKELIHTPEAVLVEGEGISLKGQGMRLEIAKRRLTILSHIETTLQGTMSFQGRPQTMS